MPLPDPALYGYAPTQATNPIGGVSQYPAPDWADPVVWDRAVSEAQAIMAGASPSGNNQGVWRAASLAQNTGDITPLINALTAQYQPGGQFGNSEAANGIVQLGILGSGIGS